MEKEAKFFQLQALVESKSSGRAALQNWMVEEYPRFQAMFGDNRIDWVGLTAALNEMGFRNSKGDELKVESVRQTWIRATRRREVVVSRKRRLDGLPRDSAPVRPERISPAPLTTQRVSAVVVVEKPVPEPVTKPIDPSSNDDDGGWGALENELNQRSGRT